MRAEGSVVTKNRILIFTHLTEEGLDQLSEEIEIQRTELRRKAEAAQAEYGTEGAEEVPEQQGPDRSIC